MGKGTKKGERDERNSSGGDFDGNRFRLFMCAMKRRGKLALRGILRDFGGC